MANPDDLFAGGANIIRGRFGPVKDQFTVDVPLETNPDGPEYSHEVAQSATSMNNELFEAKSALALETIKRENAEAQAELRRTVSSFQAENALFRESIRDLISTSKVENSTFREQMRDGVSQIKIDLANHSKEIEGKVSGLKQWVLTGTIAALVSAVTLLAGALLKQPPAQQPAASPVASTTPIQETAPPVQANRRALEEVDTKDKQPPSSPPPTKP